MTLFNCTFETKRGAEIKHETLCRDCYDAACKFFEDREIYGIIESQDFDAESCQECGLIAPDPNKAWYDTSKELSDKPR